MKAKAITPILNVSDMAASFAWFAKWGWKKCWDWGTPPTFGAVGSGECEIFLCHGAQGGRGRPDEDEAGRGARHGEARILREEAVAGMEGLSARGPRGRDDLVLVQIALSSGRGAEGHRHVSLENVEGFPVGIGEDGDGGDSHLAAGPDDPYRDFATIGDQNFLEGGPHGAGMITGLLRRGNEPPRYFEGWASTSRSSAFAAGVFQSRAPTMRAMRRPSRSMRYAVGGPKTP